MKNFHPFYIHYKKQNQETTPIVLSRFALSEAKVMEITLK